MYKIFKAISKNTVITIVLIAMICLAAYLNYIYKPGNIKPASKNKNNTQQSLQTAGEKSKGTSNIKDKAVSDASVETDANNYFAQSKLDRESNRAKEMEWVKAIINDNSARPADRDAARKKYLDLVSFASKENAIENMLAAKGFKNSIVTLGGDSLKDATASVIVSGNITDPKRAQIEDAVMNTIAISDFSKIKIITFNH